MVQVCYLRIHYDVYFVYFICYRSDGKDRKGLKLEKVKLGLTYILNAI